MKHAVLLALLVALFSSASVASDGEPFLDYHGGSAFLPQSPSVTGGGVGALANPAAWAVQERGGFDFWWDDRSLRGETLDNWGYSGGRNLGFAVQRTIVGAADETYSLYDYQVGLSGGDRRNHFGVAWRWSGGRSGMVGRENSFVVGSIHRPSRYVSVGLAGTFTGDLKSRLGVFDLGVRPLGKPWVTLFGDYSLRDDDDFDAGWWGAGFEVRPWRGIHLGMKFREAEGEEDFGYSLNIGLTLDGGGFHVLPGYDKDGNRGTTTYLVRMEPPYQGLPVKRTIRRLFQSPFHAEIDLERKILTYQKARWFDDRRVAWIDLARALDRAKDDPSVDGVVVHMGGLRTRPSLGWELREKLSELREAGKEVTVHIDETTMLGYYIASAADRISLDPAGGVMIPGVAAYRTYVRGTLDKLGIGVEEWRYFTHKSALESFSRKDMSDADKEQFTEYLDAIYGTVREGVCEGRGMTHDQFDALVDDQALFTAMDAYESGLVDTLGRWHDLKDWFAQEREATVAGLPLDREDLVHYDERWGRPPEVAIVYALGVCAMDEGIKGRATSEHMRQLAKNGDVAAVVLRADSPGGEPLPSDLVAEATNKLKEAEKPVVVSQGDVAGSGGYWISMNGSKIVTTPFTITGSIGVIGGWFWDNGVGEKTGFSADGLHRGKHADLFAGIRYPYFGTLPTRNLDEEEKGLVRDAMFELYDGFVEKVAKGRKVSEEHVRDVGEGRIWMGEKAVELELCDQVGTLEDAVQEAKALAGIEPDEEVVLTEYPPRPPFRLGDLFRSMPAGGRLFGLLGGFWTGAGVLPEEEEGDYDLVYLRSLAAAKGRPTLLTPPEALPEEWRTAP